jgi:DNA recombination protein Rad52
MTFTSDQIDMLSAKLDGAVVRTRNQGGRDLSYIEGWWAIAECNRIFGFGEWSHEIIATQCVVNATQGSPNHQSKKHGEGYLIAYTAHVVVTVGDQRHGDFGYGQGLDFNGNVGQAHESAVKEAVTDAMKRALRHWGSPFGLALYDKDQREVERPAMADALNGTPAPVSKPVTSYANDEYPCPIHVGQKDAAGKDISKWFLKGKMKTYRHPNQKEEEWCDMTAVLAAQLGAIVERGAITNEEILSRITGLYGDDTTFRGLQPQQQLAIVAEVVEATARKDDDDSAPEF